jgi:hypothetical protein
MGTVITTTPDGYYVNDKHVEGTKTVTNNGNNVSGHLTWSVVVSNGKITWPNGDVATRSSTRTREMVGGQSTVNIWDDAYDITGSASGINRHSKAFTATIGTPLHTEMTCGYIMSGTITHVTTNRTAVIDFGNGTCDNVATVSCNGHTKTINL